MAWERAGVGEVDDLWKSLAHEIEIEVVNMYENGEKERWKHQGREDRLN